jgi:hypothetical protein
VLASAGSVAATPGGGAAKTCPPAARTVAKTIMADTTPIFVHPGFNTSFPYRRKPEITVFASTRKAADVPIYPSTTLALRFPRGRSTRKIT